MTDIKLTPAQRAALEWLHPVGLPICEDLRKPAIELLRLGLAERYWRPNRNVHWKITTNGEALRKELGK